MSAGPPPTEAELGLIRDRHAGESPALRTVVGWHRREGAGFIVDGVDAWAAVDDCRADRGRLLAEVDRLQAAVDGLRAAAGGNR